MKFAEHLPFLGKAAIAFVIFSVGYYFPLFKLPESTPAPVPAAGPAPSSAAASASASTTPSIASAPAR